MSYLIVYVFHEPLVLIFNSTHLWSHDFLKCLWYAFPQCIIQFLFNKSNRWEWWVQVWSVLFRSPIYRDYLFIHEFVKHLPGCNSGALPSCALFFLFSVVNDRSVLVRIHLDNTQVLLTLLCSLSLSPIHYWSISA